MLDANTLFGPQLSPLKTPEKLCCGDHLVQFYENDKFLAEAVASYAAPALNKGEGVILIATQEHLDIFEAAFKKHYLQVDHLKESGQLLLLNAQAILKYFMVDQSPDPKKFFPLMGQAITDMQKKFGKVKAYGEMVNILWKDGNLDGTIALEKLWNNLSDHIDFTLLCAYSMEHFNDEKHGVAFREICHTHTHVIPTEEVIEVQNPDDQLRMIATLQQQARSLKLQTQKLEHQISEKKEVETALQQALHLRDEFLAIAGHEIKTPLTSLRLQTQILQRSMGKELTQETIDKINTAVQRSDYQGKRLTNLVEQLLDLTRIRLGKIELDLIPLDMVQVTHDIVENLKTETILGDPHWALKNTIIIKDDGPLLGNWDKVRLGQIISNLVSNAVKYGDNNPIEITLTSSEYEAYFTVKDYGIGIDPENLKRIFNRFERASDANKYAGLGLGLYIVKELVDAHKGKIDVTSTPENGTHFKLSLPLDQNLS